MSKRILVVFLVTVVLTATAALGQLAAPANLTATPTATGIAATAAPVSGATGYKFDFKDRATGTIVGSQTTTLPQATLPTSVTNQIIDVIATAHNTTTTSAPAAVAVTTYPAPPTNIKGLGGPLKVIVSWTAAPGATSYQLTLSNGMSFTTTATSYTITGLQTATSYNLIMASLNTWGTRGAFSNAVVVRTANIAY